MEQSNGINIKVPFKNLPYGKIFTRLLALGSVLFGLGVVTNEVGTKFKDIAASEAITSASLEKMREREQVRNAADDIIHTNFEGRISNNRERTDTVDANLNDKLDLIIEILNGP